MSYILGSVSVLLNPYEMLVSEIGLCFNSQNSNSLLLILWSENFKLKRSCLEGGGGGVMYN